MKLTTVTDFQGIMAILRPRQYNQNKEKGHSPELKQARD
jgi:hypothetical protein